MAGRPIKAGPRSTSSPAGLSHWPPRPPEVFPRACQGEQWAALRARGLVGERLIHPHTPCCLLPSPRPGRPSLPDASLRPAGRGPKMQRGAHPQASSGCLPCSEQVMMGGLSGSSRHVLPAAGGGEEGGESAGPAPPRRGTHDGGGSGTGGGARSGTCAHAARPAPPRSPALPIGLIGRRREQGGRSRAAPERAGAVDSAGVGASPRGASVFRLLGMQGFSAPDLCFLTGARPALRAHAPHFTHSTSKHPRPHRSLGDGSPEVRGTVAPFLLGRQPSPRVSRPQPAFLFL